MAIPPSSSRNPAANLLVSSTLSKLWHSDANVRVEASAHLIAHLQKSQSEYQPEEEAASRSDDASLSSEVSYTLRRLVRGLASPRESSRLGFAVALTELLARLPSITAQQVLSVLLQSSQLATGARGQEERDLLFSRLFGVHAIVSSGLLFRSTSTLQDWRVAVEETLYLGERKAWLRESAGWVVQLATKELLKRKDVPWRQEALQAVVHASFVQTTENGLRQEWTPEKLAMVIMLQEANVETEWSSILQPTFPHSQILASEENLPTVSRLLRGLSTDSAAKKANEQAQSVFFGNGQLHYVWREILEAYFPSSSSEPTEVAEKPKKKKAKLAASASSTTTNTSKMPFLTLYNSAVEDSLFSATSALSAKYVGLTAFEACFSAASADIAPHLLTPNFMRTLMNHLSKGDRTLHAICIKIARSIPVAVKQDPEIGFEVLMKLFKAPYGNTRFDAMTHSKTAEGTVAALSEEGVHKYSEWLKRYIIEADQQRDDEEDQDEGEEGMQVDGEVQNIESRSKATDNKRSWAIDQLLLLVRKHSQQQQPSKEAESELSSWTVQILEFLALHGFFSLHKSTKKASMEAMRSKPEQPFSPAVQSLFRSRFFSALAHLISISRGCRGETWARRALDTMDTLQGEGKYVTPLFSDEESEERAQTLKTLKTVQASANKARSVPMAFLMEVLLLQSYDPAGDAPDVLEELQDAANALFSGSSNGNGKAAASGDDDEDDGEEAEPISVLIDLLVTLLQQPSALLRTTVERVFAAFTGEVGEQALQLLLDQISSGTEAPQQEDDEMEADDEEEDEEEEDEKFAGMSKKERKAALAAKAVGEDDSSEDDSEDDDEEGDLGIDLDADPELREKVEAALRSMGMADDNDNDDEEDDAGEEQDGAAEEELLDDDQMMQLDEQLAEIFRAKKATEKGAKADQEASLNTRLKIVDLLEIYAKQQASNPLLLQAILPLFDVARKSGNEETEVAVKASRVLRGIVTKPKEYPTVEDAAALLPILSAIHAGARRAPSPEFLSLANSTSLYISRIILGESGLRHAQEVVDTYQSSWTDYMIRKGSRLQPSFFVNFVSRFRTAAWPLKDVLLEASSEETQTKDKHRRCQAFQVLAELVATHAALKTDEAKRDIISLVPSFADTLIKTVNVAASGDGMQLNAARLREISKSATQAIRASKTCVPKGGEPKVWDLWKVEKLCSALASLAKSDKLDKARSLGANSRQLVDLILEGSGRAKVREISQGLPAMLEKNVNGKPLDKLAKRQIKKEQKKEDQAKAAEVKAKKVADKKRKAAEVEEADTSSDSS